MSSSSSSLRPRASTLARVAGLLSCLAAAGCSITSHPVEPAQLGTAKSSRALAAVIDQPGPIELITISSADWVVPRSGVLDLSNEQAEAARLADVDEPIQLYFHALRHPQHGLFIIDTGVERALRDAPERAAVSGFVTKMMRFDELKFHEPLGDWLSRQDTKLAGVLLTHLHLDHLLGLPDVPPQTPIYIGPGEASARAAEHALARRYTDSALAGKTALRELAFQPDPDQRFGGVLDLFGDGSVWALWTPGHTPGSLSFVARTPSGPVLLTGDTCHTRWGWEHGVTPGSYTSDHEQNARSLSALRKLASEHPRISVRLGHQS